MDSSDTAALAQSIELTETYDHHSDNDDNESTAPEPGRNPAGRAATCYRLFFASGRTDAGDQGNSCDPDVARSSCFKRKRQGYFLISFISLIVLAGLAMIFVGYYLHNRGYLLVVGIIYPWVVGVPTCYVYCQYRGSRTAAGRRRGSTIALSSAMNIEVPPPQYECRHQFTSVDYTYTPENRSQPQNITHANGSQPGAPSTNSTTECNGNIVLVDDDPPPPYEEVARVTIV